MSHCVANSSSSAQRSVQVVEVSVSDDPNEYIVRDKRRDWYVFIWFGGLCLPVYIASFVTLQLSEQLSSWLSSCGLTQQPYK